jgi:hypothetical protein
VSAPHGGSDDAGRPPDDGGQGVAHVRLHIASMVAMFVFAASLTAPSICLPQLGDEFGLDLAGR